MPSPRFEEGNQAAKGRGANKVSTKVKEAIVGFLENNIDQIQESFDELKPREKLDFIANILPYAAPKLSSVESDSKVEHSGGIRIEIIKNGTSGDAVREEP